MGDTTMPSQEELRRRFRAARALSGLTFNELAERLPREASLGERTLRKLEYGEAVLRPPVLKELARALGVADAWFEVDDVREAFMSNVELEQSRRDREFNERLAALEREIAALGGPAPADVPDAPASSNSH